MKYFLLGRNIKNSPSPQIHEKFGLNYSVWEVTEAEIPSILSDKDCGGFNVTIPFKKTILPYLDGVSENAKNCGCVNVVKRAGDKLLGFNTDVYGMEYMIGRTGYGLKDKRVLILGGGATKDTATFLAKTQGAASVDFVSRSGKINYENCYDLNYTQVIINATPVGGESCKDELLADISRFGRLEAVFDCVYSPLKTPLLFDAEKLGLIAAGGLSMLVKQAALSYEIWTDKKVSENAVNEVIGELIGQKLNIVLVGMPGAGKTFVGRLAAQALNKKFIDVDREIERVFASSCETIIEKEGETAFREKEALVVKRISKETCGAVIATGGGAVERSENVKALKANGFVVYVERELKLLSSSGRPLSKTRGVQELFESRKEKYIEAADAVVKNDREPDFCVKEIIRAYENYRDKRA